MIIPNDTVIAVADGQSLRLFRNKAAEPYIALEAMPDASIEIRNEGSGMRHRSTGANPDRSRLAEDDHAASVASYLNRQVIAGEVGQLVVIADPRTLGEMRKHFHPAVASALVGEIAKDLTGQSVESIKAALVKAS
jgi:protein required for attachment to host cells